MIIQYLTHREVFKSGSGCRQVCNHLVYLPPLPPPPPQMVANGYKPITIHNQLYKRMPITLHLQFIIDRTKSNMRPRKLRRPGQKLPLCFCGSGYGYTTCGCGGFVMGPGMSYCKETDTWSLPTTSVKKAKPIIDI